MGSASLSKPSSSQVTQTTAVSTYSASGFSLPSNSEYWLSDTSYYLYSYSGLTYSWEFSDGGSSSSASGAHTFTGLSLGTDNILRIKIGVGAKPHPNYDLASWVLSKFPKETQEDLNKAIKNTVASVKEIITGSVDSAMNKYNS